MKNDSDADRNRYYWLVLKSGKNEDSIIKKFWIAAVTEEGIIMFVKVKAKLEKKEDRMLLLLLQQTTYYKSQGKLEVLYR